MGWYAWTLASSNFFAPVITGFINDGVGYKWAFFFQAIFCGVTTIFLFFFMEETNFDRSTVGVVAINPPAGNDEENGTALTQLPIPEDKTGEKVTSSGHAPVISGDSVIFKRKTYWQKLALIDKPRPFMMHWRIWQILKLISWPVVFYSGFSYGSYLVWFNILNATASLILGGQPYNFKPSIVGLSYISCIIGVTIASVFTGVFSDWFVIRLARKNKGIFEPEQRLWLFAATTIILPAGSILWGVGAAHEIH